VLQNPSNSEVTNLYLAILSHENVLRFQISMQNFPVMYVLNCESDLNKPVKNLTLGQEFLDFLLVFYLFIHVSAISIVHDDTKELLVHEGLSISDDVGMSHSLQNSYFVERILLLLALHVSDIDYLKIEMSLLS